MSRATVDLQAVRFFLGYGLIFLVQSAITILIAAVVMFALDPRLAAVALAPTPFVVWIAFRYGQRNRPGHAGGAAAHRRADGGGRGEHRRGARGEGLRAGAAPAAALQQGGGARVRPVDDLHAAARVLLALHRLPPPARPRRAAARGRQAGDQRHHHDRRVHRVLRLRPDAHRSDALARHGARDGAAGGGERRARVRAARPRAAARCRARRQAAAARRRTRGAARRELRLRRRGAGASGHRPRRRARPDGRASSAPRAPARRRS